MANNAAANGNAAVGIDNGCLLCPVARLHEGAHGFAGAGQPRYAFLSEQRNGRSAALHGGAERKHLRPVRRVDHERHAGELAPPHKQGPWLRDHVTCLHGRRHQEACLGRRGGARLAPRRQSRWRRLAWLGGVVRRAMVTAKRAQQALHRTPPPRD